jgi:hypothetical protein
MTEKALMKFEVRSRWTGDVQFTAEIDADDTTPTSIKLGLAVKWARKSRANLSGADLYGADLYGANLYGADLSRANLSGANLSGANLSGADLYGADLYGANLYGADLSRANLYGANLSGANLSGADLSRADLSRANLYGANLYGANLSGANLYGADLSRADLSGAKNAELVIARTRILPEGEIIGWKKCRGDVIAKLRIPTEAKRSHAFGRKCRAEYVDCLEIFGADKGISLHDGATEYVAGQRITPDGFDDNWQTECGQGVHFYLSRIEAENHA